MIRTLHTTSDCPDINTCPSEHVVDTDPRNLYVIAKNTADAERDALVAVVPPGHRAGWMPGGFLPDGHPALVDAVGDERLDPGRQYVAIEVVDDVDTLAAFAHLTADDEFLGTVPALVGVGRG